MLVKLRSRHRGPLMGSPVLSPLPHTQNRPQGGVGDNICIEYPPAAGLASSHCATSRHWYWLRAPLSPPYMLPQLDGGCSICGCFGRCRTGWDDPHFPMWTLRGRRLLCPQKEPGTRSERQNPAGRTWTLQSRCLGGLLA